MNAYQDANNILAFSDSRGTKGNYVQDVDGNVLLDLCGTESLPLGHNHSVLIKVNTTYLNNFDLECELESMGLIRCKRWFRRI